MLGEESKPINHIKFGVYITETKLEMCQLQELSEMIIIKSLDSD